MTWIPVVFYIVLVAIGLIGARKRHTGFLKFYWITQFISLFLMIFAFAFLLFMYYRHRNEIADLETSNGELTVNQQLALECAVFVLFVINLVLKVRSIVLAQRLSKQLEILPYVDESELNNVSEESEIQDPNMQPMYVMPQPMFVAPQMNSAMYPGANNLIPIYVDSFGNPIINSNFQTL